MIVESDSPPLKITTEKPQSSELIGAAPVIEIGGPKGLEPTRFGDWEQKGRCTDF